MKILELTKNKQALIDDEYFDFLNQWKWTYSPKGYAYRGTSSTKGNLKFYMHREIMGLKKGDGRMVDHVNRIKLDNRISNLRICNKSINCQNLMMKTNTSGFKGVSFDTRKQLWVAQLRFNKTRVLNKYFKNKIVAAKAYNVAATKYYGVNAFLNVFS